MHEDLLRRALESGKTTSRKAKVRSQRSSTAVSPSASPGGSRQGSRPSSRVQSRHGSDDEVDELASELSVASISLASGGDDFDDIPDDDEGSWQESFHSVIVHILDSKRRNAADREQDLRVYINILQKFYAAREMSARTSELFAALFKILKAGESDVETVLALKAMAVTMVTDPEDGIYDRLGPALKTVIENSGVSAVQTEAIRTLGVVCFYGDCDREETLSTMQFFLDIVQSDGSNIEAEDDAAVVAAAIEGYGFLASQIEDLEDESEDAIDAFVEQLDADSARVQIAAGEVIALLYEKAYTPAEPEDEGYNSFAKNDDDQPLIQRYTPFRRHEALLSKLEALSKISGKSISRAEKKALHTSFADIRHAVENPTLGPSYSSASSQRPGSRKTNGQLKDFREWEEGVIEDEAVKGSRKNVRISKEMSVTIDEWLQLLRLNVLKRVLQGGFGTHYDQNEVVYSSLPFAEVR